VNKLAGVLLTLLLSTSAPAQAGSFRLAWVDLLSEDSGRWLNNDLPMLGATPGTVGLRYLYQVQPVWQLPIDNLYVGTSVSSQSLHYERSFKVSLGSGDLGWFGGIHTRLVMPNGAMAGLRWKTHRTRIAAGVSATTPSTWARPSFKVWSVLPTVGVSIVLGKPDSKRFKALPQDRVEQRMEQDVEGAAPDAAAPPAEGSLPEGTGTGAETTGALPEGTVPGALPEGTVPGALPDAEPAPDEETLTPASEAEGAAPTGPTAVEFGAPMQVELPSNEPPPPTSVELPSEPAPTQVIIGSGDESEDDSSQDDDNSDD